MHLHMVKIKKLKLFFIGYKDDKKIRPLCVKLPQINRYVSSFKETKYMSFEAKNNEILLEYNKI